jgi:hypothetical protein
MMVAINPRTNEMAPTIKPDFNMVAPLYDRF